MGILHGNQSIVTDGLVLALDGASNISFDSSSPTGTEVTAQTSYTTPGVHTFEVPSGITQISAVCIGGGGAGGGHSHAEEAGGGGGGGALSYGTISVTPLEDLGILVGEGGNCPTASDDGSDGGASRITRGATVLLQGGGGEGGEKGTLSGEGGEGGVSSGTMRDGGGEGGNGGAGGHTNGGGGGGTGGYSGDGGYGSSTNGSDGAGGGGGGGGGNSAGSPQGGGGVGFFGEYDPVENGEGGVTAQDGEGGSGGTDGTSSLGGSYGGGGGGSKKISGLAGGEGADGAVRIVYQDPLSTRQYPEKASVADGTYNTGNDKWKYMGYGRYFATLHGGVSWSNDEFTFDGTDDYVDLGWTSTFNYPITTSVTLSVFVKFDAVGALKGLLTKNRSTNTQLGLWLDASSKLSFSANGSDLAGSTSLTTGTWYNLVGVQLSNTSRKIYINGVLDGTKTSSFGTTPSGSENWMLGQATGQTEFLDGKIANASIYNKALTAAEVLQNYNAQKVRFGL